jgi:hypothetical protein
LKKYTSRRVPKKVPSTMPAMPPFVTPEQDAEEVTVD